MRLIVCAVLSMAAALAAMPVAAASSAAPKPAEAYKDLPGVKPPGMAEPKYKCRMATRTSRQRYHWAGRNVTRESLPYLVYRCEADGYVYEGTTPPLSWEWLPGINPHHLPD